MMESGVCVNDTKWWVLLTSWGLGIVQCELDQLGKLAGKPREKKRQGQDFTSEARNKMQRLKVGTVCVGTTTTESRQ